MNVCHSASAKCNDFKPSKLERTREMQPKDAIRGSKSDAKNDILETRSAVRSHLHLQDQGYAKQAEREEVSFGGSLC